MKIKCNNCKEIIKGDKKGGYITCKCGLVAIDETPNYCRIIGNDYIEVSTTEDIVIEELRDKNEVNTTGK